MTTTTQPQAASDLRTLAVPRYDGAGPLYVHENVPGRYDICKPGGGRVASIDRLRDGDSVFRDAARLDAEEIAAAVNYVRALARPAPDATPAGADVEALRWLSEKAPAGEWGYEKVGNTLYVGILRRNGRLDQIMFSVDLGGLRDDVTERRIGMVRFASLSMNFVRAHVLTTPPASAAEGEGLRTERETEAPIYAAFERYVGNADEQASDFRMFATGYHAALTPPPAVPPTRVAGLDRDDARGLFFKIRDLADDIRYARHSSGTLAASARAIAEEVRYAVSVPTPGETPGQDAVAGVPDGWKLVPVEPTAAMAKASRLTTNLPEGGRVHQWGSNAWTAMLAAAPLPATPASEEA